jgi:hypothetical protein
MRARSPGRAAVDALVPAKLTAVNRKRLKVESAGAAGMIGFPHRRYGAPDPAVGYRSIATSDTRKHTSRL